MPSSSSDDDDDDGKLDGPHREPLQAAESLLKHKDTGDNLAGKDATRSQDKNRGDSLAGKDVTINQGKDRGDSLAGKDVARSQDKDTGDSLAGKDVTRSPPSTDSKSDPGHTASPAAAESEDSDSSDVLSPCKNVQFRNRSVLLSDDDSTENDDNADGVGDRHEDSDHVSESSESSSPQESRRCTLEKQKLKQLNKFQKLREAHTKRKSSIAKT